MGKERSMNDAIALVVSEMMDKVMDKVLVKDPFIKEKHHASKPLYAALVPDEIFKGSHFERRFVTPFGNAWERLAKATAEICHGKCATGYTVQGTIGHESLRRIQETLNRLEHRQKDNDKIKPCWKEELAYIKSGGGQPIPASVTCDILTENIKSGEKYAFELKGPLPNSDQTKVSKEKLFKLMAMNEHPVNGAFYALPYNPYMTKDKYNWSFPMRWFNMQEDECVLIGDEFWDFIGGEGTYQSFICEINKLGAAYRERIYREYLGIEPPENFNKELMK